MVNIDKIADFGTDLNPTGFGLEVNNVNMGPVWEKWKAAKNDWTPNIYKEHDVQLLSMLVYSCLYS